MRRQGGRFVPHRQRIEILREPLLVDFPGGLPTWVQPLTGKTKFLQRLGIKLRDDGLRLRNERGIRGGLQIVAIDAAHPALVVGPVMREEALRTDVGLPLLRIRFAAKRLFAILATEAREEADARRTFVVDDEVGVASEFARPVGFDERRELEPRRQLDQHVLPRPHIAVERQHRVADRIRCRVRLADRAVEKTDRVVALKVGRVRQHQISEAHRLAVKRVSDDQEGNLVIACLIPGAQHLLRARRIHRTVPRHVGHEQDQRVDGVRVALDGVLDHRVHHAVRSERCFP